MTTLSILPTRTLIISHPALKKPLELDDAEQESDGRWFVRLSLADIKIKRLLLAKVDKRYYKVHLTKVTDIIGTLIKLRDGLIVTDNTDNTADAKPCAPPHQGRPIPLEVKLARMRESEQILQSELARIRESEPISEMQSRKIGIINAPSIGDTPGVQISVYLEKTRALWACMDRTTIDYLMNVCAYQLDQSGCTSDADTPTDERSHATIPGAKWCGTKRGYCVKYFCEESARARYKYFRIGDAECDSANANDLIKERIATFMETL